MGLITQTCPGSLEQTIAKAKLGPIEQDQLDAIRKLLRQCKQAERELDSYITVKEDTKGNPISYDMVKATMAEASDIMEIAY
jgi:hypothetical protein